MSQLMKAALYYGVKYEWPIFPLKPGDKVPLTAHGVKDATIDANIIRQWWLDCPAANIGLACGKLIAVDLDVKPENDGRETWAELGIDDSTALINLTPTGGQHLIWRNPNGQAIRNSVGRIGPGIDVRGKGGYIVLPPSIHPNGKVYAWEVSAHPADREPQPIPPKLYALLSKEQYPGPAPEAPVKIRDGQRNSTLTSLAGTMRRRGLVAEEIFPSLIAVNERRCDPPISRGEVWRIAQSVGRYEPKRKIAHTEQKKPPPQQQQTEGNKNYWSEQYSNRWGNMRGNSGK